MPKPGGITAHLSADHAGLTLHSFWKRRKRC